MTEHGSRRDPSLSRLGQLVDLPVLVLGGSAHARGLRPRGAFTEQAYTPGEVLPSANLNCVGAPKKTVSGLNTLPARAPVNASPVPSRTSTHDSGSSWGANPSM